MEQSFEPKITISKNKNTCEDEDKYAETNETKEQFEEKNSSNQDELLQTQTKFLNALKKTLGIKFFYVESWQNLWYGLWKFMHTHQGLFMPSQAIYLPNKDIVHRALVELYEIYYTCYRQDAKTRAQKYEDYNYKHQKNHEFAKEYHIDPKCYELPIKAPIVRNRLSDILAKEFGREMFALMAQHFFPDVQNYIV